jgi:hypothetical protein
MTVPDTFSAYYADLLQGTYDCLDRIVLNAFYPPAGGMRTWWRHLHGDDSKLNDDPLRDMAGTFSRRPHALHELAELATESTNWRNRTYPRIGIFAVSFS